ncbi:hypothetical protein DL768_009299 [Monosporascus sp. mg162]|nr:hypothetical protein DL768_009299 [Monosporascus sp. mg162]
MALTKTALPGPRRILESLILFRRVLPAYLSSLLYHVYTGWLFIGDDIKNTTTVGVLFAAVHAYVAPILSMGSALSFVQILAAVPSMMLWTWSNLFLFNLHNQRQGMAEDALNKPWRPLPSRRLTSEQATFVTYFMYPTTWTVAIRFGGLVPCLFETAFSLWYNELGGSGNPFLKSLLNGVGLTCFLVGPLEVATGHAIFSGQGKSAAWIFILAAAMTVTSHIQDFRDVEGDRAAGRRTIPLTIGDMNARVLAAIGGGGSSSIACKDNLFWFFC